MQQDFDNTFESLLRRASTRQPSEVLPENASHLDADSISAFAENALPDAARIRFAAHFADCSDCRQILINFAAIQEAEENETVETKPAVSAQPTWSERFTRWFAIPNLGYAAAALTVLFVGVFAFVALQSRQQEPVQEMAQVEIETEEARAEKQRRSARTAPVQPEPTVESTPEALPEAATNFAETGNANLAENTNQNAEQSPNNGLPPSYRVIKGENNSGAETARQKEPESQKESNRASNTANNAPGGTASTVAARPTPTTSANLSKSGTIASAAPTANKVEEKSARDQATEQTAPAPAVGIQQSSKRSVTVNESSALKMRSVGNKTFQNLDGVWRDKDYNGQAVNSVSRGSEEYKKLDNGLRSVADSFKGATVIIIWQGKAYRIS
jgi:hypothetical protein